MKYRPDIWWVCVGCMLLATSLMAQMDVFAPANDVSFAISTERNDYGRDIITVKYQITDIGKGPLYVPRGFEATACVERQVGPHIWGGFENSAGQHFEPGYARSCGGTPGAPLPTVTERMSRVAVLLHPGEHLDGALKLDPGMFHLPPGAYRIRAVLHGWKDSQFSGEEQIDLAKLGNPFLSGDVTASTNITLLSGGLR